MRKVYRKSFFKATSTLSLFTMLILSILFRRTIIESYNNAIENNVSECYLIGVSLVFIALIIGVVLFILCHEYFYVIIDNSKVQIKNGVFPFLRKEYDIKEIDRIVLGNTGGLSQDYIQINFDDKKSRKYVIELVDYKEYNAMLQNFSDLGIETEILGNIRKSKY